MNILDVYVEAGGSFLDTANVYAAWIPGAKGGESETVLGQWMKDRGNRQRLFLATKVGSRFQKSGYGLKPAQIETEVEGCLARLGTDHVDLLYSHFDDRDTPLEDTLAAFDRVVRAGKARFLGASNHRAWRLETARNLCETRGWARYACIQQRYSYLQPHMGATFGMQIATNDDLLDYCRVRGLTLLAYSPLLGGLYSGRTDRHVPPLYAGPQSDARLAALQRLAREKGVTANQLVLAWMRHSQPAVLPIIAASNLDQVRENLAALEIKLTPEDMQKLNQPGGK